MDEVDSTILLSLRGVGYDLEDGVTAVRSFSAESLFAIVSFLVSLVDEKRKFPKALPVEVSRRFRICNALASYLNEDLGFEGELGYNSFLYPDEEITRKLLLFLLDQVPRTDAEEKEDEMSVDAAFRMMMRKSLEAFSMKPWLPHAYSKRKPRFQLHTTQLTIPQPTKSKEILTYYRHFMPLVSSQPARKAYLSASVFERNTLLIAEDRERGLELQQAGLEPGMSSAAYWRRKNAALQAMLTQSIRSAFVESRAGDDSSEYSLDKILASRAGLGATAEKGSRFTHQTDFSTKRKQAVGEEETEKLAGAAESAKALAEQREKEAETLKASLVEIEEQFASLQQESDALQTLIQQITTNIAEETIKTDELEVEYKVKKRIMELLPNCAENLVKLQQINKQSAQRLLALADEWEQHRLKLLTQFRDCKEESAKQEKQLRKRLEQIKEMRADMKELVGKIRSSETLYGQLAAEYAKLPKNINHSMYTRRILDSIKSIKKQKADIDKILVETYQVRKEINTASETLNRTYVQADEEIFKRAQTDQNTKEIYRKLVAVHGSFKKVLDALEETATIENEVRDLESLIDQQRARAVGTNREQIENDLRVIRMENEALSRRMEELRK